MISLQIFWSFVKKYWFLFLAVAGFIVGFILFRRSNVDISSIIEGINDDHKKDLESIKNKNDTIKAEKEKIQAEQEKKLAESNKKFNDLEEDLHKQQKERTEEILKETNSDPDKLAEELAKITGSKKLD